MDDPLFRCTDYGWPAWTEEMERKLANGEPLDGWEVDAGVMSGRLVIRLPKICPLCYRTEGFCHCWEDDA